MSSPQKITHVAVGIVHNALGQVLYAQRPAGKPYAGWWEFPGGKIETDETTALALARELREELGIQILDCHQWRSQRFSYPHADVHLHLCHVHNFKGEPQSLEKQAFLWGAIESPPLPFLPAALSVLKAMQLPQVLRLTAATELGFDRWHTALFNVSSGVIVVHEPTSATDDVQVVFNACLEWKKSAPMQRTVLVSSRHPRAWWGLCDGVHLTERDMLALKQRPSCLWVGSSAHTTSSVRLAAQLGCNYATVGSVLTSASHPDNRGIGWGALSELLLNNELACYAVGGLNVSHQPLALAAGAAGMALKRAAW